MAEKTISYVILAVIAITAIVGLVLLFNAAGSVTGDVARGGYVYSGAFERVDGVAVDLERAASFRNGLEAQPLAWEQEYAKLNQNSAAQESYYG